ncbi:nickel/cobalt ABC transporter permease [Wolinella succinogenes]|uniref:nickel/cobalt ABC transporter permease n=1 Tax=Wolinella succinogenes TaxID=844 RepID=UPI0024097E4C|nr:nickel/cobalt ABC transporter permease [Wolinella succinogenes]
MNRYLFKRLVMIPWLLLGISFFSFGLMSLSPSDPAEVALRMNDIVPTPDLIREVRLELGLDRPFLERYLSWLTSALQGDLGVSYVHKESVIQEILAALPITLALASASLVMILFGGFGLGVLSALYEDSPLDRLIRTLAFTFSGIPNFWLGLWLIWLFSIHLNLLPTGGLESPASILLPSFTLACAYISTYVRLVRHEMIQQKSELYVLYARARGLSEWEIGSHILKNALRPSLIALGVSIPKLIAGSVIIENIFALPGVGRICVQAIFARDYPMIQGYILMMAVLFLFFNLLADLLARLLDPRMVARP